MEKIIEAGPYTLYLDRNGCAHINNGDIVVSLNYSDTVSFLSMLNKYLYNIISDSDIEIYFSEFFKIVYEELA